MNLLECPALLSFLRRYSLAHAYYYPGMTVVLAQFIPLCMSKLYIFFFFSWPQGKAPLRYLLLCLFLLSFLNVCGGACSSCGYKASFWLFIKKISIVFNCLNFSMCCVLSLVAQLCPTLCDLMDCSLPGSSVHGDSPGKNTRMGCHALLQGIFPIQGLNPVLPHYSQILYCLSH